MLLLTFSATCDLLGMVRSGLAQTNSDAAFRLSIDPLVQGLDANLRSALVTRIQQVLQSLPPSAPQLYAYRWDRSGQTWIRSDRPGPTALWTPWLIPPGELSLKASLSYFGLRELQRSVDYAVTATAKLPFVPHPTTFVRDGILRFGVQAQARVTTLNAAVSYGLLDGVELDLVIPFVWVDAHAGAFVSTKADAMMTPPQSFGDVYFASSSRELADSLTDGSAHMASYPIHDPALDGATQIGVGRITLGSKLRLQRGEGWDLGLTVDFMMPSPSTNELAGSNTGAFFPRLIGAYDLNQEINALVMVGYNLDFSSNELRSFVWQTGVVYATAHASLDLGLSGAVYNEGLEIFRPTSDAFSATDEALLNARSEAINPQRLSGTFVDFVAGVQVPITEGLSLSGVVTVPIGNLEFRPYAVGTLSATYRF